MTSASPRHHESPARRRLRRTVLSLRWWHNWIGVFMGTVLSLWVISGLIMILPQSEAATAGQGTGRAIDWSTVVVAPAQAVRTALAASSGSHVANLGLQRLRDGMVYVVRIRRAAPVLVDAASGAVITIGDSMAVAMAAEVMPGTRIEKVERFDQRPRGYTGPLPAVHVVFGDAAGTEAWVMLQTGEVRRNERSDRLKAVWGHNAHVFQPLKNGPGGEESRKGALWITSLISMASILTGYWLSLPRRFRNRFG